MHIHYVTAIQDKLDWLEFNKFWEYPTPNQALNFSVEH